MVKTGVVVHLKIQTEEAPRWFGAKTDVLQRHTTSVMGNKLTMWCVSAPCRFWHQTDLVLLLFSISSKITTSVVCS